MPITEYACLYVECILNKLTSDIHRPSPCMSSQGVGVAAGLLSPLLITVILKANTLQRHALNVMFYVAAQQFFVKVKVQVHCAYIGI